MWKSILVKVMKSDIFDVDCRVGPVLRSMAYDAMVGRCRMSNVRVGKLRHMAIDTAIARIHFQSLGRWKRTTDLSLILIVALHADGSIMGFALLRIRADMRVVTGDAPHLLFAGCSLKAFAPVHLLDVIDRLGVILSLLRRNDDSPKIG